MSGAKISPEGADLNEVEVALHLPGTASLVISSAAVVGDKVARLEFELLEKQRVSCGDLLKTTLFRVKQVDRLLRPTIDRVGQAERADTEIVIGSGFKKHFFDRIRRRVTTRLDEHD